MSQMSEGNFSDIIPDVENFINDNDIQEQILIMESDPNYFEYADSLTQDAGLQDNDYKLPMDHLLTTTNPNYSNDFSYNQTLLKYPPEDGPPLEIDEYAGDHEFEVLILPNGQKIPWEFSPKLNKIFITMCTQFRVGFVLKNRPTNTALFIRATPVFSQLQYVNDLVHRCVGHEHANDNTNKGLPEHIHQHIIRCQNNKALYCGNKELGKRLSVIVPLDTPEAGTDKIKEYYSFACKNSCTPGGMSRRPIQVIFTLENENGEVLGRRVMSVRVCSCPKRDKDKEEREMNMIKGSSNGKKRKLDNDDKKTAPDNKPFQVNFTIIGKENYRKILDFSRGLMAVEIVNNEPTRNGGLATKKCYKAINDLLKQID